MDNENRPPPKDGGQGSLPWLKRPRVVSPSTKWPVTPTSPLTDRNQDLALSSNSSQSQHNLLIQTIRYWVTIKQYSEMTSLYRIEYIIATVSVYPSGSDFFPL